MMSTFISFLCVILGGLLLAFALFSYEGEEKKVKNLLEDAWLFAATRETSVNVRLGLFLSALASATTSRLNRIYGADLLSKRAYLSSICLCIGLGGIVWWLIGIDFLMWAFMPIVTALLLVPMIQDTRTFSILASLLLILTVFAAWVFFASNSWNVLKKTGSEEFQLYLRGAAFGSTLDFLAIASMRKFLSNASVSTNTTRVIFNLAAVAIVIFVLLTIPIASMYIPEHIFWMHIYSFSLPAALLSSAFGFTFLLALLVRLLAAIAPRAIYSALKFKAYENRKSLATVGIALVGSQFPQLRSIFESSVKSWLG